MYNKRSFLLQIIVSSIASNMCLGVISPCFAWEKSGTWETGKTYTDNVDAPKNGRTMHTDKDASDCYNYGRGS